MGPEYEGYGRVHTAIKSVSFSEKPNHFYANYFNDVTQIIKKHTGL